MLAGFYTNMGMGAQNLVYLHLPSIGREDIAAYLLFDRIYVDREAFDMMAGLSGGQDKWLFGALAQHGLMEPKRDYYAPEDVWGAQELFVKIYQKLEPHHPEFPEPGRSFERVLSRARSVAGQEMIFAYYTFMKNYLGLMAAKRLDCALINADAEDIGCRVILEHRPELAPASRLHALSGLIPTLNALQYVLETRIDPFPLSVSAPGTSGTSYLDQVLNQDWPETDHGDEPAVPAIPPVEAKQIEDRLQVLLALRKAERFETFRTYLLQASELIDDVTTPAWLDRVRAHHVKAVTTLRTDVGNRLGCAIEAWDEIPEQDRAQFWKMHPEHAWYGFLREDWMGAVGRLASAPLH